MSKLLSTYVNNSCVWGERKFLEDKCFFNIPVLFRYLSRKGLKAWSKNFGTILKLPSTCTIEYFKEKTYLQKKILFSDVLTSSIKKRTVVGKKYSARLSKLTFNVYNGPLWGKKSLEQSKVFLIFFRIRASKFPKFSKTSGTFVKTVFYLYNWSIVVNQISVKNFYFLITSGVRAELFRTSGAVFSALLSKCILRLQRTILICVLNIFPFHHFLGIWATTFWFSWAKYPEKLSNCRLRVRTSISRRICFLQKNTFIFFDFLTLAIKNGLLAEKKFRHARPY